VSEAGWVSRVELPLNDPCSDHQTRPEWSRNVFCYCSFCATTHFLSSHHPHQPLYQPILRSHSRRASFARSTVTIETLQHLAEGVVDGVQHILHPTPTRQPVDNMPGEDTPEVGDKGTSIYRSSVIHQRISWLVPRKLSFRPFPRFPSTR